MRKCLIPVRYTCHIILSFKQATVSDAYLLNRNAKILFKADWIL